jgi:ArsR family transcriptional regulator
MRDLIKGFKALSDETRIRILKVLLERECCVCEVMQALEISQTRASRNLGLLQDAGFVKSRRDGLWVVYSIDDEGIKSHCSSLLDILRKSLDDNELVAADRERLKQAVRVGPRYIRQGRNK